MSSALPGPPAILPDIAVVIVTYNSAPVIGDLLDSLPRALDSLTADVVVVDNGSIDGTAELWRRWGHPLVRSGNVGTPVASTAASARPRRPWPSWS